MIIGLVVVLLFENDIGYFLVGWGFGGAAWTFSSSGKYKEVEE